MKEETQKQLKEEESEGVKQMTRKKEKEKRDERKRKNARLIEYRQEKIKG